MNNPADWVGRRVTIIDGIEGTIGETGTVLAVDDTPYRPAAWVKVGNGRYKGYRSCDLCWLQDIASGEFGPVWSTKQDVSAE
jgi:hypothetical protein